MYYFVSNKTGKIVSYGMSIYNNLNHPVKTMC